MIIYIMHDFQKGMIKLFILLLKKNNVEWNQLPENIFYLSFLNNLLRSYWLSFYFPLFGNIPTWKNSISVSENERKTISKQKKKRENFISKLCFECWVPFEKKK